MRIWVQIPRAHIRSQVWSNPSTLEGRHRRLTGLARCQPRCVERPCCMGIRQRVTGQNSQHLLWPLLYGHLYLHRPQASMHTHASTCTQTHDTLTNTHNFKTKTSEVKDTMGHCWGRITVSSVPFQDSVTFRCSEDQVEYLSRALQD